MSCSRPRCTWGPADWLCGPRARGCCVNKDSQGGQQARCPGPRGCQESQGSQVGLGPPRKRKHKIGRSVPGRRGPGFKRNHAFLTVPTTLAPTRTQRALYSSPKQPSAHHCPPQPNAHGPQPPTVLTHLAGMTMPQP